MNANTAQAEPAIANTRVQTIFLQKTSGDLVEKASRRTTEHRVGT